MKPLNYLRKLLGSLAFFIVIMFALTATGLFDSTRTTSPEDIAEHEIQLRIKAETGQADAQNELGALLYKRAQKGSGSFDEAISSLNEASAQDHPIAQMNLAYAYKRGHGVTANNDKAIELFHHSGLNFLRIGDILNAKDRIYNINRINAIHPLKRDLVDAIARFEEAQ
ncbi:MAG: sel1 repeat family protein [Porticoccaceae bacterium]|nr:sel1 repeat family protein [Porticoccaceae bacterium]